ncbi:MAG: oxidoreductase, partial [Alphaproteobacteria bacterium]|nr:oxidoreductase [Alphaproteobacteria bacterium]
MTQTLNVALVGYGLAGRHFHAPLISSVDGLRLAVVISRQTDKIRADHPEAAPVTSPDDAFADPSVDLVVIATTNNAHFDLAARALDHGKHVVVDKPFAVTSTDARELVRRSKHAGRLLSVFHNRRWDSDYLTVRRLISQGELGEIVYFESHFDRYRPKPTGNWREKAGPAAGLWFDLAPHLVDQALCLFGMPRALFADFAVLRDGVSATDYFHVLMRYEKLRVVLTANFLAPADDLNLVVHGTRASYVKHGFDSQEAVLRAGGRPSGFQWGVDQRDGVLRLPDGTERVVPSERGDYTRYYAGVRDAILGVGPLPVTAEEALAVMDIIECGERSAAD